MEDFSKSIFNESDINDEKIYFPSGAYYVKNIQTIFYYNNQYVLSNLESKLLYILYLKQNRVVLKEEIVSYVWENKPTQSAYKNLFYKLRKKVGKESLISYSKRGYMLICR